MKVLVFDIWGEYAHYKKNYATTSAISYCLPTKPAMYGYVSAILGFERTNNQYLNFFQNKECLIGIGIMNPIVMQRLNINLRATLGRMKETDNRKPTTMEFVYKPRYRIFFFHKQVALQAELRERLEHKNAVYTPTMGLASLLSNFKLIGELQAALIEEGKSASIHTVVPKRQFERLDIEALKSKRIEIIEQSMYAVEMDNERNVTERDDILLERKARTIDAFLRHHYQLPDGTNIALF